MDIGTRNGCARRPYHHCCLSGFAREWRAFITGEPCSKPDDFERRNREHQDKIVKFVRACEHQGHAFDLVHDKSGSFWQQAAEINVPVLATLHLPRHFYSAELFVNIPKNVVFN